MTLTKIKPFRMIGNLYFVGTKEASSHLLATEEGLILIDTGYAECADIVCESIKELGFDIKDVKYIIHSHGHGDHTAATAKLLTLAKDAKTFLHHRDVKYVKDFTPDFDINDGDVIRLGSTKILCLYTPGHTEGTCSFFFDVTENSNTYRAGMFGGAGVNQLKKSFMDNYNVPYIMRGTFLDSIERLMNEKVDVFVGNHTGQNKTLAKMEAMATADSNPFIDSEEWCKFLAKTKAKMEEVMLADRQENFVAYAHRGAPAYCPENTFLSFYTGMYMGANGIETDIQVTKDGVLVLFHDDTLNRVCEVDGSIRDYTFEELQGFLVKKNGLTDKIPTFEDFLIHFAHRDITFAIELKELSGTDAHKEVADLIFKYGVEKKTVVTSFNLDYIKAIKEYAPTLRVGFLAEKGDVAVIDELIAMEADEYCPIGEDVTPENVAKWHRMGLNVRAWGAFTEEIMKNIYHSLADGMTVNFPDKLVNYMKEIKQVDKV